MLQSCQHLEECEAILAEKMRNVTQLGEGNLMPKDVRILRNMFKDAVKVKIAGVKDQVFKLARYRELYPMAAELADEGDLQQDFAEFKRALDAKLERLKEEKERLTLIKEELKGQIKSFSKNDQRLIHHADDLVVSIKEYQKLKKTLRGFYKLQKEEEKLLRDLEVEASPLFQEGWHPEYGVALRKVDFFELDHNIADLQSYLPQSGEGREESVKVRRRGKGAGLAVVSLALILAGITFPAIWGTLTMALGFAGIGSWFILTKGRNKSLKRDGKAKQEKYREAAQRVRDSLQGLPVKMELLEDSPLEFQAGLSTVKDLYEQFCLRREHVRELKKHIMEQEKTIRETAVGFAGSVPVTLDDSLPVLMQSLSKAREKKSAAEKSQKELDHVNKGLRLLDKGGEIRLRLPRQRIELPQEESRVTLELGGKYACSTPLNCRFLGESRVEMMPFDLRLPCLEGVVPLTLMVGRQGVRFFDVLDPGWQQPGESDPGPVLKREAYIPGTVSV